MGARHHQRPNSIGRDEFDDGGENQFVTNYEAEMSALKPRETFTLSPIKKDPEMSYVEPVVNQGKKKPYSIPKSEHYPGTLIPTAGPSRASSDGLI